MAIKNTPFDDSQEVSRARSTRNQNSDLRPVDAYRQGVELTQTKHYVLGMLKFHAGFNQSGQHNVPQLAYGQSQKIFLDEKYHRDVIPTEPSDYTQRTSAITNVIVDKGTDSDVDAYLFDGVIEPLDIRDIISRKRVSRRPGHKSWGALGEGNVKNREGSDVVIQVVKLVDIQVGNHAYVDNVNTFGSVIDPGSSISPENRKMSPFNENYDNKGVMTSSSMTNDFKIALNAMLPSTVNLIPSGYEQFGGNGFDWVKY